jgi:mannose-6-phosphate isomerase-like protein (cupin superfamily)
VLIRKLKNCTEIIAGDSTKLRELLHPNRQYKFNGCYSLAHARLDVGEKSDSHKLNSNEVYYILHGKGEITIDNDTAVVEQGDVIDIPSHSVQSIKNISETDLEFLCIVDPAWKEEDEEILE